MATGLLPEREFAATTKVTAAQNFTQAAPRANAARFENAELISARQKRLRLRISS